MRLMLGECGNPSLLVNVDDNYSPERFDFYVVNGCWEGSINKGRLTVHHPSSPWSSIEHNIEILSDNQDRLRGNYQDVFDNWDNTEYVAPQSKAVNGSWDDDIPF